MKTKSLKHILLAYLMVIAANFAFAQTATVPMYQVHEITFQGETYQPQDAPAAEVDFTTTWRHESGSPSYTIHGFYDGDGKGGMSGNVFKVRFCPTRPGKWTLEQTTSSDGKLNGQHQGYTINCTESSHKGFWKVDEQSPGKRWYQRSDGSHAYIVGNTLYSFLSEHLKGEPTGGNIADDVRKSSQYFRKLRFAVTGDIFPHPTEKPFLDEQGKPTDHGKYAHRPNPAWFSQRVDLAVKTAYEQDLIADMILNGPDSEEARSALLAAGNGGDPEPYLRYIAARYGSYPHVWICLSNEYDIRKPKFKPEEIRRFGFIMKDLLPYENPLSVHSNQGNWNEGLNSDIPWNDHIIIQNKIKKMSSAADYNLLNYWIGGGDKPVVNDELAYQGEGDGWNEGDVIEAHLGAFLGGGYGSSGHKSGYKLGHYFAGNFNADEHTAADNLHWMCQVIDENINFWKLEPEYYTYTHEGSSAMFHNLHPDFRVMRQGKEQYVLGTNQAKKEVLANLPEGNWEVKMYDIIAKQEKVIAKSASGKFTFDAPDSRAMIFHFKKADE